MSSNYKYNIAPMNGNGGGGYVIGNLSVNTTIADTFINNTSIGTLYIERIGREIIFQDASCNRYSLVYEGDFSDITASFDVALEGDHDIEKSRKLWRTLVSEGWKPRIR